MPPAGARALKPGVGNEDHLRIHTSRGVYRYAHWQALEEVSPVEGRERREGHVEEADSSALYDVHDHLIWVDESILGKLENDGRWEIR